MMLLDNSVLPKATFNSVTSILIADAKEEHKKSIQFLSIHMRKVDALCSTLESATSIFIKYHITVHIRYEYGKRHANYPRQIRWAQ